MRADLTYSEVGHTVGELPLGYHHVHRLGRVGEGVEDFERASELLLRWEMHRRAGLSVSADQPRAGLAVEVEVGLRFGPLTIKAPCRVVRIVDEPHARGFAYGTLPGHPECGEESFVVRLGEDHVVRLEIIAFSKPARWFSRLGSPVARLVQSRVTDRYIAALVRP